MFESEDPNARLHNKIIGGFYKIKSLECIIPIMPLPNPNEEEKMINNVQGNLAKWRSDEIIWVWANMYIYIYIYTSSYV